MHGLEGSSTRGYVRNVCRELQIRGIRTVALNFRGCSGEPNRRESFYHSGATADPAFVLERIRESHPDRTVGAVGFSLGGNILLKLMGERQDGGRALVDAAVAMSVPYDLSAGCSLLEQSAMGRAYASYFLRSLKRKVRSKESRLSARLDLGRVYRASTLRTFDDLLTAPVHGFSDAEEYYAACSSTRFLEGVRVPTLLLHAEDDPFLPRACIPRKEATSNRALNLLLHSGGGHVGFLEGPLWRPRFWADERTADFLALHLGARPSAETP
jgi:predicted alpha/beta-fold hydrolase